MGKVIVGVGSTNPTKVEATRLVFSHQFIGNEENTSNRRIPKQFDDITVQSYDIESIVSSTPQSDEEQCKGATHRAMVSLEEVIKQEGDDNDNEYFGVGLEAGFSTFNNPEDNKSICFLSVWAAVMHKKSGRISVGCSARAPFSETTLQKFESDKEVTEMKELLSKLSGVKEIGKKQGGISLLTDGGLTRQQLNEQALHCALAPFICPSYLH